MTRPPAAARRGFFPGDDLSQMPSGGRQIEWLKISRIIGYREYLHDPQTGISYNLLTGRIYKDPYTAAAWAELTRSLTEEGFREPLKLEYEPDTRRAYLGEGNHRLVAAGLAGYTAVPVWALRGYDSERMRQARRVPGEPELTRENGRATSRPASGRPMCSPTATFTWARTRSSATGAARNTRAAGRLSTSPGSIRRNGGGPGNATPACARTTRTWPPGPPLYRTRTQTWTSAHGWRCHPAWIPEPRSPPPRHDGQLAPRTRPARGGHGDPGQPGSTSRQAAISPAWTAQPVSGPRDTPATDQAIRPGHAATASGTPARTHAAHGASSVLIPVRSNKPMRHPRPDVTSGLTGPEARQWASVLPDTGRAYFLVGNSAERSQFIAGLRALAAYLETRPGVPVPRSGCTINVFADGADEQKFAQVDLASQTLRTRVADDRNNGGHYQAERSFGPVAYGVVAVSDERRARHQVGMSYYDAVAADPPARQAAVPLAAEASPRHASSTQAEPAANPPPRRPPDGPERREPVPVNASARLGQPRPSRA